MIKNLVKKIAGQKLINYSKHLPLAVFANFRYGFPAKRVKIIGVTGTDGKTTTTNMIYRILKAGGKRVSMISTINAEIAGESYDTGFHVTSPNPFLIQKFLKQAAGAGDEYVVLEITSHALDQFRALGIRFDIGVITNITHEHLDYHKNWEGYFKTKAKLIKNVKVAVLNQDEKHLERLKQMTKGKVITFGLHKTANFNPLNFPLNLKLPGDYNLANALAASAVAVGIGIPTQIIKQSLSEFKSLQGRMQDIENKKGIKIFVDFAHTPNGLEQALKALRLSFKKSSIIALIGAEGYRDKQKRPMMGKIGATLADILIITEVDSRGLIDEINRQILEGAQEAGGILNKNVFIEKDRTKAISMAINNFAKNGDVVGIFGKGHERSMNLDGKKEVEWSDEEAVKKALKVTANA